MNFIKSPFIPTKTVRLALIDYRMDLSFKNYLLNEGIELIETEPCKGLYQAISGHPDILCHPLGYNRILIAANTSESLKNQLIQHDFELVVGNTSLERNYPKNIAYNVARIGGLAFHNTRYTDPVLKEELARQGVKLLHVKQGYTKCSVAVVGEDALITSDRGIAKVALDCKLDVLLIRPANILLRGMNYGFIGGSCGLTAADEITFIGDISRHPDYKLIRDFLDKKGVRIKGQAGKHLTDYGSIIPLLEEG
ncbi:MAG: DUF6873 family GME fold protein [Caldicoprobacterales bacterium]